jgi:hypothetical protein
VNPTHSKTHVADMALTAQICKITTHFLCAIFVPTGTEVYNNQSPLLSVKYIFFWSPPIGPSTSPHATHADKLPRPNQQHILNPNQMVSNQCTHFTQIRTKSRINVKIYLKLWCTGFLYSSNADPLCSLDPCRSTMLLLSGGRASISMSPPSRP